ncbi:MAG: Hpt domain-containing protein [Spirochaetaceae bacterium]
MDKNGLNFLTIDSDDGLDRVGGDIEFYKELLLSFFESFSTAEEKYHKLIQESDITSARIIIHSIKGASGNIGAKELQKVAGLLEDSIKTGDINRGLEPAVFESLNKTILEIESIKIAKPEIDLTTLISSLKQLVKLEGSKSPMPFKQIFSFLNRYSYPQNIQDKVEQIVLNGKRYKFNDSVNEAKTLIQNIGEA